MVKSTWNTDVVLGKCVMCLHKNNKEVVIIKGKIINWLIFIISLVSLLISLKLFWNMGVYVDEYGSSPVLVCGGDFWLYMDWLRLGLLFVLCVISGYNLFKRK